MARINLDQILTAVESGEYLGICIACGFEQEGVEPDARKYTCHDCAHYWGSLLARYRRHAGHRE